MEMIRREHQSDGRVVRHETLLHTTLEGQIEGTQPRGRKRIRMVDDIRNGSIYAKMKTRGGAGRVEDSVMRNLPSAVYLYR